MHATLAYQSPTPLSGTVTVGLRSRDLATPPNTIDREIARFTIQGATDALQGDINRTAGWTAPTSSSSASTSAPCAATPTTTPTADFNDDGRIDGLDLAILSSNFGQSKPAGT